jgi:hypothetical protein
LNITSYTTGSGTLDRFTVDGAYGRLFGVSDSVTGTIFSVNDAAGLPVIEVESNLTDKITMGTYGSNALVVDNVSVGIGTGTPSGKLHIVDATLAGTGFLSGSALNIQQTWNTSGAPTAIKLNVFDIASTGTSNLMDLQVGGLSKFKIDKSGSLTTAGSLAMGTGNAKLEYTPGGNLTLKRSTDGGTICTINPEANVLTIGSVTTSVVLNQSNNTRLEIGTANTVEQRNGLAPQESRIYGTYTNATNFERLNLKYNSTDSAFQIGTEKGTSGSARPLQLQTDGATRMTLSTGGNVGIGTTTPDTKLYVVGKLAVNNSVLGGKALDVYTAEAGSAAVIQSNGLTNGEGILQLVSTASSGVAYALRGSVQSNSAGIITIQQNGVGDAVLEALSMSVGDSMSRYLINGGASYSVGIDNSDSDKFKISNSSVLGSNDRLVINDSGYVGIGTTTPAYKLSISDTNDGLCFNSLGRFSSRFYHNNYFLTYDAGALDASNNAGFSLTTTSSNTSPGIRFINSNAEGGMHLSTNASNQANLNFTVAGYGTLTLRKGDNRQGNAILSSLTGDATYNNASLLVRNRWDGSPGAVIAKLATSTTADIFQVTNESLSPYFNVTATGNVGVGVTTPSARLHIGGGDTSLGFTGASLALGFSTAGTYPHFIHTRHNAGTPVSNAIDFYTSNGTLAGVYPSHAIHALTLTNGSVGIGTTAPNAKLSIVETSLAVGVGQTGSALDIQQTWSSDGSPTAIKLNVTNTNSAAASKLMDLQVSGVSKFKVGKGTALSSDFSLGSNGGDCTFTAAGNLLTVGLGSHNVYLCGSLQVVRSNLEAATYFLGYNDASTSVAPSLRKEADHVLSQRNGSAPQAYRLYNTYTSDTNFERLNFRWDSLVAKIGTSQGSTSGVARDLVLETSGIERVKITADGLFSANGVSLGKGGGNIVSNLALGASSLNSNITGYSNLAIGRNSLYSNQNGVSNISLGENSLYDITGGSSNIVIGSFAATLTAPGELPVKNINSSILIGNFASTYGDLTDTNCIAIGDSVKAMASNSVVLGNDNIVNTYLKGAVQIHRSTPLNPIVYERIAMRWNGTTGTIGTSQTGAGKVATAFALETNGTARVIIATGGNVSNSALFSTSGFAYTGIAPATTGAPGVSGEMAFSANFLYRHNGTNWQRTGIGFANW